MNGTGASARTTDQDLVRRQHSSKNEREPEERMASPDRNRCTMTPKAMGPGATLICDEVQLSLVGGAAGGALRIAGCGLGLRVVAGAVGPK